MTEIFLKAELLRIDKKINQNNIDLDIYKQNIEDKINNICNKQEEHFKLLTKLSSIFNADGKTTSDKLNFLYKFKDQAECDIAFILNKISNFREEYESSCNKYEKLFVNNLIIPEVLGSGCKYENIKEYIEVRILI